MIRVSFALMMSDVDFIANVRLIYNKTIVDYWVIGHGVIIHH